MSEPKAFKKAALEKTAMNLRFSFWLDGLSVMFDALLNPVFQLRLKSAYCIKADLWLEGYNVLSRLCMLKLVLLHPFLMSGIAWPLEPVLFRVSLPSFSSCPQATPTKPS